MKHLDDELLENYILDRLTESEKQELDLQLEKDPNLSIQFNLHRSIIGGVELYGQRQFKLRLQDLYVKAEKNRLRKKQSIFLLIVVFLLLGLGYLFHQTTLQSKPKNYHELYAEFFSPYPIPIVYRGGAENIQSNQIIKEWYAAKKYNRIINYIEVDEINYQITDDLQLLLGITYLEQGQFDIAEQLLLKLLKQNPSYYDSIGRWYLAMVYLKQGNKKEVEELLTQIIHRGVGPFAQRSKQLLKKLSSLPNKNITK